MSTETKGEIRITVDGPRDVLAQILNTVTVNFPSSVVVHAVYFVDENGDEIDIDTEGS